MGWVNKMQAVARRRDGEAAVAFGGSGTIAGTILGVFIMSVLQTGLPLIGLQANYQQIIIGLVLIIAVYIDVLKNKKLA